MRTTLLVMIAGGLAQSSVVPAFAVGGAVPDMPLVLTALVAFRHGPEHGAVAGFAAGLVQDSIGGGLIGVQALTKALAGFVTGGLVGRLQVTNPLVQVPALVLLTLAEGAGRWALLQFFHYPAPFGAVMLHVILPQALYNGLAAGVMVMLIEMALAARRRRWA